MNDGTIKILNGELAGTKYQVKRCLSIGRSPNNDLWLDNRSVSRFHCEVSRGTNGYWIRDHNSYNGTYVNGKRIDERFLRDGDEISILDIRMSFSLEGQPGAKSTARDRKTISLELHRNAVATLAEIDMRQSVEPGDAHEEERTVEDALSPEEVGLLLKRYRLLYQTNLLIAGENPLVEVYQELLHQLFYMVPADRALIMVRDAQNDGLIPIASHARENGDDSSLFRVSRTIIHKAMDDRTAVLSLDARHDKTLREGESIVNGRVRSVICAPLLCRGEVLGIIYLDTQQKTGAFDQDVLQLVTAIGGAAAIAIKNSAYIEELRTKSEELRQSYLNTINVLANAIEARDRYTIGHAWRVTHIAMAIANALEWDEKQKKTLEMGGLLHDVGKVGVKDAILCKEGRLEPEEYDIMKLHPEIGTRMLQDVPFLEPVVPYVRYHHERWDGNGYPEKRRGTDIPIEGRVTAIADTFDAMTSNRVYRKALAPETALREIESCKGSQFDPDLVEVFLKVYHEGKLELILQNKGSRG